MSKKIDEEVIENYRKALEQKYNAVCLDIDGTITEKGKKTIDSKIFPVIAELLKRHIPIVFITGRGETGLEEFKNELIEKLENEYSITKDQMARIYVLVNDGARLFKTSAKKDGQYLTECEYIASDKAFEQLELLNDRLLGLFAKSDYQKYFDITYSKDFQTGKIINIRLNVRTENIPINNKIYNLIKSLLKNEAQLLNITEGNFQGRKVLQIGVAKKEIAVRKAEQIIGIPKNSMLLIGDRGDEKGNDYTMLDSQQGFSVLETSKQKDRCFPILDENNNVLTGVDATIYLLTHAKILPTICLEKIDKEIYKKQYAEVERSINQGRIAFYNSINWKFNDIFQTNNGFSDIFDPESGSIMIPMYEWVLIDDNNPLKKFFSQVDENNRLNHVLKDEMNILLRGSKTYYYLLANRESTPNEEGSLEDYTSQEDVISWLSNYKNYFADLHDSLYYKFDYKDPINKRLFLGILDNIRNVCLVCINTTLLRDYDSKQCNIINLDSLDNNKHLKRIYNILLLVLETMRNICVEKEYQVSPSNVQNMCRDTIQILEEELKRTLLEEDHDYSKTYRAYRESDNFIENYLTTKMVNDKSDNNFDGICGICYGGIELPIIYKMINPECDNILMFKFPDNIGNYRKKHTFEIRRFGLSKDRVYEEGVNQDCYFMIADDNILTAKTIQLAINIFYDIGLYVDKILVVRYPSVNRLNQMTMDNNGAADYKNFFSYIQGLLFPSPYSFRDNESKNKYLDSLGIFDLNREKILKCLFKNHDYKENTEVAYIKRKI